MSDPKITQVTNNCGELIRVGETYSLNEIVAPLNDEVCKKKTEVDEVKVVELLKDQNGSIAASVDAHQTKGSTIRLLIVHIDYLFRKQSPMVAGTCRPASFYTDQIKKS